MSERRAPSESVPAPDESVPAAPASAPAAGESAPATDGSDAVISYSHLDRAFAIRLRDALRDAGERPWLDETEISGGTRWSDALERAIQHADAFVFLLSPHSAASRECRRELDYALELNKRILPVRVAETPIETLPPRLGEYQFIPSRALFGDDFAGSTQQLITEIETDRDWVREHTDWSEKATEWDRHDRNRSYLLSGVELRSAESWRSRAAGKRPGLSTLQSQFIDASRQHATSRLRRTRGAVSVALAVAIGLAVLALILRSQAVSESHTARSGELAARSLLQLGTDPQLALKLAIASAEVKHTTDALNALRAAIPQNHLVRRLAANDGQPLVDAQWSSDGTLVATASVDNHLRVYRASTGQLVRTFADPALQRYPGGAMFIDGDRELLGWGPGRIHIWSMANGRQVISLSDESFAAPLSDVVVNRQGTMIATAAGPGEGGAVLLWDARTGRLLHTLRRQNALYPATVVPQDVAFSPNGQLLAGGSEVGIATVWSTRTGRFVRQLNLGESHQYPYVFSLAFSPNGEQLATAQANANGDARGRTVLWNVSDWSAPNVLPGVVPAWSHDGSFVTTTQPNGDVYVWRVASLTKTWARAVGYHASTSVAPVFGPGTAAVPGDLVIPSQSGYATVWNPNTGDVIESLAGDAGSVSSAGFSSDGSRILTWSSDGSARIWDNGVLTGSTAPHSAAVTAAVRAAAAAEDSTGGFGLEKPTDLLTPVAAYSTGDSDAANSLVVFDSRTGRRLASIRSGPGDPEASFDRAGDLMIVTGINFRSKRFYLPTELRRTHGGALVHTLPRVIASGELSPDGKLAATVSPLGDISVWSIASGRRLAVFRGNQSARSNLNSGHISLSFSPDSTLILSSDGLGRSFVWKARTGHLIATMKSRAAPATQMSVTTSGAISADDRLVVLARDWDDDATVYKLGSSAPLVSLVGNSMGIVDVAFSPDSQLVATLDDGLQPQVRVYDTANQQPLLTINAGTATAVGFSADNRSVITDQRFPYEEYPCSICGGFDQLLAAARHRNLGGLTAQERELYLR